MVVRRYVAAIVAGLFALTSCASSGDSGGEAGSLPKLKEKESYTIGFAGQQADHPWTIAFNNSITEEIKKRGHKLVYTDAQASTAKQVENVESLIAQKVDAIIITPREEKPLAEATLAARDAGIPVFIADRPVDDTIAKAGKDYVAYIGSDFYKEGQMSGEWLKKKMNSKGTIVELAGTTGSGPAKDRGEGFRKAIAGTDMEIIASQDGDFIRDKGRQAMETLIQQHPDVDAVFAHNDEMALGAITALTAAGKTPGKDVTVVSVDGQKEALQAIAAGKMGATAECNPRFGPVVLDAIEAYGRGEKVEPKVMNKDKFFEKSNAAQNVATAY